VREKASWSDPACRRIAPRAVFAVNLFARLGTCVDRRAVVSVRGPQREAKAEDFASASRSVGKLHVLRRGRACSVQSIDHGATEFGVPADL
jgi:hypothetical protein